MITLSRSSILSLLLVGAASLSAQTAPAVHHPATTAHTVAPHAATAAGPAGCAKDVPELSPKLPALPAGTPCIKALLTFTTSSSVKLDYVSPLVTPEVREALGLTPVTFSLLYSEVKPGAGELALPKKFYTMKYTGYLLDGTRFDSSADHGGTFTFPIGIHHVIAGWDLGLQGMHVGGKRRLYIPWQLAYGDRGQPPSIPARAGLIFDIELVSQSVVDPTAKPAPVVPAPVPAPHPAAPPAPGAAPSPPPPAQPATPPPAAAPKQ